MNYFIITVDTEGDYIWHTVHRSYGIRKITVENAKYIERFQKLCQKYHFIPTYLVNYEMAFAEPFVSLAKEWAKSGECEIGMHLHAWNTPPLFELPYRHKAHNPYAGEYPTEVLFAKMKQMTETIEKQFGTRLVSHRGGRWYLDGNVLRFLGELGYIVDCSVTPGASWERHIGYKRYGADYSDFPMRAFWLSHGTGKILEVPPTMMDAEHGYQNGSLWKKLFFFGKEQRKMLWLRPNAHNLGDMLHIVEQAEKRGEYLEFMIHSSELMPGGSPTFPSVASIEKMYADMETMFARVGEAYRGISLGDFARRKMAEALPTLKRYI